MPIPRNIGPVVADRLCTGCGICQNACPRSAILMIRSEGGFRPVVESSKCNECGLCSSVCAGRGIPAVRLAAGLFPTARPNPELGRVLCCFSGFSSNPETRYRGASGGLVTGVLTWMLDTGRIDGAVVTCFSPGRPLEPQAFIARTQADLRSSRSSKYCPVSLAGALREAVRTSGRFAVVGLPCHLQAIRLWEQRTPSLGDRLIWRFGIYCSSSKTFAATEYLLHRAGVRPESVRNFAYRDEGCLGSMRIEVEDGSTITRPYKDYYPSIRSFFIPRRCTLCHDQCAELADVSFGDIHIPEFWDDKVGVNSVVVRTDAALHMLESAVRDGAIEVSPLDADLVVKSQAPMLRRKKRHLQVRLGLLRFLRRPVPSYDDEPPRLGWFERLSALRSALLVYAQITIGRSRRAWPLIRALERRPARKAIRCGDN